ncbi:hypothetical protein I79_016794 [Cricetulus griseus]|uniref:Secreted protein n=1 Tax=Cricetulus griseus TaxID=10029 RepID=G3I0B5_CRIGR|nr:hypothetical protein I79_016794 [Cricetulus griseus]
MLSVTIMMELFLCTGSGGEVECIGHGLGGHGAQQLVHHRVAGVICTIQRVSQGFIGPNKKQRCIDGSPKAIYM